MLWYLITSTWFYLLRRLTSNMCIAKTILVRIFWQRRETNLWRTFSEFISSPLFFFLLLTNYWWIFEVWGVLICNLWSLMHIYFSPKKKMPILTYCKQIDISLKRRKKKNHWCIIKIVSLVGFIWKWSLHNKNCD